MNKKEIEQRYNELNELIEKNTSQMKSIVYEIERLERYEDNLKRQRNLKAMIIFSSVLILLGLYFNPLSESLQCYENYECSVEHKFIFGITKIEKFELSNDSYIVANRKRAISTKDYFNTYISFIDKNNKEITPFIQYMYTDRDSNSEWVRQSENLFKNDKQKFEDYKLNTKTRYSLKSSANYKKTLLVCILLLILPIIIYSKNTI